MTIYQQLHIHGQGTDKPPIRATPDNSCTRLAATKKEQGLLRHAQSINMRSSPRFVWWRFLGEDIPLSRTDVNSYQPGKLVSVSSVNISS